MRQPKPPSDKAFSDCRRRALERGSLERGSLDDRIDESLPACNWW